MARKRLCKVVDLTSVKRRGQAVVAENYVYDGDQLVAVLNATGAIQYEYFDGSSLDQVFADQTVLIRVLWPLEDLTGAARVVISTAGVVLDHRKIDSFRRSRLKRVRRWTMTSSSAVCHGMRTTAIFTWVCCLQELWHRAGCLALVWRRAHWAPQRSREQAEVLIAICNAMRQQPLSLFGTPLQSRYPIDLRGTRPYND